MMKPMVVKKHQALVWSLAFSPDGKTLASGSADNNVVIWDVATAEDLMTLKHNGAIEALRFSPDGRLLATASHEPSRGSVCLWHAPPDEDAPANTLRANGGPSLSDRPARLDSATAMRPTYPDPTAEPYASRDAAPNGRPGQGDRRAADPAAPTASSSLGFARPNEDRYNAAPSAASAPAWPSAARPVDNGGSTDPSVPLRTDGAPSYDGRSPSGDGLTPPGGFGQPSSSPDDPNGGRLRSGRFRAGY